MHLWPSFLVWGLCRFFQNSTEPRNTTRASRGLGGRVTQHFPCPRTKKQSPQDGKRLAQRSPCFCLSGNLWKIQHVTISLLSRPMSPADSKGVKRHVSTTQTEQAEQPQQRGIWTKVGETESRWDIGEGVAPRDRRVWLQWWPLRDDNHRVRLSMGCGQSWKWRAGQASVTP